MWHGLQTSSAVPWIPLTQWEYSHRGVSWCSAWRGKFPDNFPLTLLLDDMSVEILSPLVEQPPPGEAALPPPLLYSLRDCCELHTVCTGACRRT